MARSIHSLWRGDEAATTIEYGLLIALVVIVCISAVSTIGGRLSSKYAAVNQAIGSNSRARPSPLPAQPVQ